jgi:hypothetical protein
LCDIIRILGFTDTGITVTHPIIGIIEAITLTVAITDVIIAAGVGIYPFHGGRIKKAICDLKIDVLGVHAA